MGELPNESFPSLGPGEASGESTRLTSELERLRVELDGRDALLRRELAVRAEATIGRVIELRAQAHRNAMRRRQDPVTGLLLHGVFRTRTDFEVARAARLGTSIACVLIELSGLAALNAARGYAEGDRVLGLVGQGLTSLSLSRPSTRPAVLGRESGRTVVIVLADEPQAAIDARAELVLDLLDGLPHAGVLHGRVGTTWQARPAGDGSAARLVADARAALDEPAGAR